MNVASSLCLNGSKYQFEVSELQWAEQFTVLLERSPQPIYLSSSGRQTTSHSYDQNALCPTWSYKVHKYPTSLPGARCFEPGTRAPRSKHVYGRSLESASRRGVKTRAVESVAAPVHSGGRSDSGGGCLQAASKPKSRWLRGTSARLGTLNARARAVLRRPGALHRTAQQGVLALPLTQNNVHCVFNTLQPAISSCVSPIPVRNASSTPRLTAIRATFITANGRGLIQSTHPCCDPDTACSARPAAHFLGRRVETA